MTEHAAHDRGWRIGTIGDLAKHGFAPVPTERAELEAPAAWPENHPRQWVRDRDLRQVMRLLQVSRSSICAAISAGDFPWSRSVRWFAGEIGARVESRPRAGGAG